MSTQLPPPVSSPVSSPVSLGSQHCLTPAFAPPAPPPNPTNSNLAPPNPTRSSLMPFDPTDSESAAGGSPIAHLSGTGPRLRTMESGRLLAEDAAVIQVVPWRDQFVEQTGHDPRGDYVERFWLAVLGPSTTWFVRSISWGFAASPEGFALDLPETARALGISERMGRNSPFVRSVTRACQFDLASIDGVHPSGRTILRARTMLPWLSRRLASSLPPSLRAEHHLWLDASAVSAAEQRRAVAVL